MERDEDYSKHTCCPLCTRTVPFCSHCQRLPVKTSFQNSYSSPTAKPFYETYSHFLIGILRARTLIYILYIHKFNYNQHKDMHALNFSFFSHTFSNNNLFRSLFPISPPNFFSTNIFQGEIYTTESFTGYYKRVISYCELHPF